MDFILNLSLRMNSKMKMNTKIVYGYLIPNREDGNSYLFKPKFKCALEKIYYVKGDT